MILDAHTHHQHAPNAVINVGIDDFIPTEGEYYSLGIHPWDLGKANLEEHFKKICDLASSLPQVVGIGETGLDAHSAATLKEQTAWMELHIQLSEKLRKPLVIHCVRRAAEVVKLHHYFKPTQPWIIHGFRGKASVARMFINEGIYLSYGERFNAEAVAITPRELLLVETDESSLPIDKICAHIALERKSSTEEIKKIAGENASTCFKL